MTIGFCKAGTSCDRQQAKRQHPNSEKRKEAKDASYYEQYCDSKADCKQIWLPAPSNELRNAYGKPAMKSFKVPANLVCVPSTVQFLTALAT
jgi:hypothetical protein